MTTRTSTAIDKSVAKKITEARNELKLSREKFSELLAISPMQLYKYETSQNRVSAGMIYTISMLTGKPIQWFFP